MIDKLRKFSKNRGAVLTIQLIEEKHYVRFSDGLLGFDFTKANKDLNVAALEIFEDIKNKLESKIEYHAGVVQHLQIPLNLVEGITKYRAMK